MQLISYLYLLTNKCRVCYFLSRIYKQEWGQLSSFTYVQKNRLVILF